MRSTLTIILHHRGSSWKYFCNFDGVDITSVAWKDNRNPVIHLTFIGEVPKETVQRSDKKEKRVEVQCPSLVLEYNKHIMGSVDLLDSLIGRYKIVIRSKNGT